MQETWVQSLGWEDPLEEEMATHSSILAWRTPWKEEPGGLQSMGSHRLGHDWAAERSLTLLLVCCSLRTTWSWLCTPWILTDLRWRVLIWGRILSRTTPLQFSFLKWTWAYQTALCSDDSLLSLSKFVSLLAFILLSLAFFPFSFFLFPVLFRQYETVFPRSTF